MQRPSMLPGTHCDFDRPARPRWSVWRASLACVELAWTGLRRLPRLARTDWHAQDGGARRVVTWGGLTRRVATWSAALPVGVAGVCASAMWQAAYPPPLATSEPAWVPSTFVERMTIAGEGVDLACVWIPAVTARHVLEGPIDLLEPRPAVLLVHDHGHDVRQMLPLTTTLHARGWHVIGVDLRGHGRSGRAAATLGAAESADLSHVVAYFASKATVDARRVAAWGVGTGALAAADAEGLAVVVGELADDPPDSLLPPGRRFDLLRPACRWVFNATLVGDAAAGRAARSDVVRIRVGDLDAALAVLDARIGPMVASLP